MGGHSLYNNIMIKTQAHSTLSFEAQSYLYAVIIGMDLLRMRIIVFTRGVKKLAVGGQVCKKIAVGGS